MIKDEKWEFSANEQARCIKQITPELASLRAKAGISQSNLAKLIGISRQTYSSIENQNRKMTWNTYLSLLFFYDSNTATHKMMRNLGIFPEDLLVVFNGGEEIPFAKAEGFEGIPEEILNQLDEAAFLAIRTATMLEYARCTKLSGDAVIKAFEGITFARKNRNERADRALKSIKEAKKK